MNSLKFRVILGSDMSIRSIFSDFMASYRPHPHPRHLILSILYESHDRSRSEWGGGAAPVPLVDVEKFGFKLYEHRMDVKKLVPSNNLIENRACLVIK